MALEELKFVEVLVDREFDEPDESLSLLELLTVQFELDESVTDLFVRFRPKNTACRILSSLPLISPVPSSACHLIKLFKLV